MQATKFDDLIANKTKITVSTGGEAYDDVVLLFHCGTGIQLLAYEKEIFIPWGNVRRMFWNAPEGEGETP